MQKDIEKSFQTDQHHFHVKFCSAMIKEGKKYIYIGRLDTRKTEISVLALAVIYSVSRKLKRSFYQKMSICHFKEACRWWRSHAIGRKMKLCCLSTHPAWIAENCKGEGGRVLRCAELLTKITSSPRRTRSAKPQSLLPPPTTNCLAQSGSDGGSEPPAASRCSTWFPSPGFTFCVAGPHRHTQ